MHQALPDSLPLSLSLPGAALPCIASQPRPSRLLSSMLSKKNQSWAVGEAAGIIARWGGDPRIEVGSTLNVAQTRGMCSQGASG